MPDRLRIGLSMTIGTRTNQARSLRYYRTCTLSGRYVATELEPKLSRYVATERPFRSVATANFGSHKGSADMLSGLQDLSHPKSAKMESQTPLLGLRGLFIDRFVTLVFPIPVWFSRPPQA
ncbi:hypothetical protein DY000_02002887 [Brassica cretica]|uniref:Uncharacterized protein n=1 Tax=Brassica cretica TaxID=69181 RepID=A0ABQ7CH71_BRACR|nr:hypothetical protein DY000_02002887 [Brassica cretica]